MEEQLTKLKQEVKGVILSSPRGLTINQFLKDYKDSIGRPFPYNELGYESIPALLRDLSDVVRLNPGYGGSPSTLVPVVDKKVAHLNSMISNQKLSSNKHATRPIPRRSILEDSTVNRKPVQLPLENRANLSGQERNKEKETINKTKDNSKMYNGYSERTKSEKYSNTYEEEVPPQNPNFYKESQPRRYSQSNENSNEYENHRCDSLNDLVDQSDTGIQNGLYDNLPDEDFERPPTPGEIIVTEKMKNSFRQLLREHPEGIPSSKFCKLYNEKFGVPLKYLDYGAKNFQEMIVNLPDVFGFAPQRHSQQWILFDSQQPIPSEEVPRWIPNYIVKNVAELAQSFPKGLKKTELIFLYRERFRVDLNVESLGFPSIDLFLQSCASIDFVSENGEEVIFPKSPSQTAAFGDEQLNPLPPISEMPYLWRGEFSDDECDPSMVYQPFKLIQIDKLNYAKVFVCDVISPSSIWLQMDDQRDELSKLMLNLNEYYNMYEQKHMMSDYSFIVNDLICAVKFHIDGRWHRAKIISHNNSSNTVTVCYVDYGTENEVSITSLRKLKKSFYDLPVQAVHSSLYGLVPKPNKASPTHPAKWTEECIDLVYNLCFEKKFNIDFLEIDETIPKLKVVLSDGYSPLTVNDKLLEAGFALSVVDRIMSDTNFERQIRSPPGYSSKIRTVSTCDRILMLREESIVIQLEVNEFYKKIEELEESKKRRLMEADVLEQMICKHPHPLPGFETVVNSMEKHKPIQMARNPAVNNDMMSTAAKLTFANEDPNESVSRESNRYNTEANTLYQEGGGTAPRQGQVGAPGQQEVGGGLSQYAGSSYGQAPDNHNVQQQQMSQQMIQPHHLPQHHNFSNFPPQFFPPNVMHNPMVVPPLVVPNKPFMGPRPGHMGPYPSYPHQPNMMYPQNVGPWASHQWNSVTPQGGMYNSYRPEMYAAKSVPVRSVFNRPTQPSVVPTSLHIAVSEGISVSTSETPVTPEYAPAKMYPAEELPHDVIVPTAPTLQEIDVGVPAVDSAEEVVVAEEVAVDVAAPEDDGEVEVVTPPPSPPLPYNLSHLSDKQIKELEKSDEVTFAPPPSNNWKDIFSISNLSLSENIYNQPKREEPQYPSQALVEAMKDEQQSKEEILEDECNKLEIAITDCLRHRDEPINHIMKICVENLHGSSYILLILVEDSVAVLLKQLFCNFWWGDPDDESYKNIMTSLKDELSLAYSIFYTEYIPIFERLKKEKFIDEDDLYVHLVNLCNVPAALDIICPSDKHDLSKIKNMFGELYKSVLPVDAFWYKSER